jgi:hypothetical protein
VLTAPGEVLTSNVQVTEPKLHYLELPGQFTGGTIIIKKNPCIELRYFFSKSSDVSITQRDGIGGFFEIRFQNDEHDYLKTKAKMDQNLMTPGASIDITSDLSNLRGRFGSETMNYLYFFCPFLKVEAEDFELEIQIDLNKNPVELKSKEELEEAALAVNQGKEIPKKQEVPSLDSRIKEIVNEIKGDGSASGVKERMEGAVDRYYEVSLREINIDVYGEQGSDVQKVGIHVYG